MDNLREIFATLTSEEARAISRERELDEWRDTNRFCGKCGAAMQPHRDPKERAFVCPNCGYTAYPQLSPAIITLITKGEEILLQLNAHYRAHWSLVAGFVEAGESLEEAVRRETREEAAIELTNIRYFGSQTWPFPANIMVAFRADYASGTLRADGEEVLESHWFRRDNLPKLPRKGSVAYEMIAAWINETDGMRRE